MVNTGLSFSPFQQPQGMQPAQGPSQGATPVQDAIRLLSFRMPSVVGAGAPTAAGNLFGQSPLGGQLQNPMLLNWLRTLLQGVGTLSGQAPMGPGPQFGGMAGPTGPTGGFNPTPLGGFGAAVPVNIGYDRPQPAGTPGGMMASNWSAPATSGNPYRDWLGQERGLGGGPANDIGTRLPDLPIRPGPR